MKYKEVGKKIRDYRHKLEMTQQVLADKIGVTWEMVSRYERGLSSPFSRIDKISEVLRTSPSQLLQNSYKTNPDSFYEVPLFKKVPSSLDFSKEHTSNFYGAPSWISELNLYVFAIEVRLIRNSVIDIRDRGIVYITTDILDDNGLYISIDNDGIKFTDNMSSAIGQVLAQEIKFI